MISNLKHFNKYDERGETTMLSKKEKEIRKRNYYVVRKISNHPRIDVSDVFSLFKRNWSDRIMDYIAGCKAIVLDERKNGIAEIYFEPDTKINDDDIKVFFKIVKEEVGGARGVIVAINNVTGEYQKNNGDIEIAKRFSSIGNHENIPVEQSYLISPMSLCEL